MRQPEMQFVREVAETILMLPGLIVRLTVHFAFDNFENIRAAALVDVDEPADQHVDRRSCQLGTFRELRDRPVFTVMFEPPQHEPFRRFEQVHRESHVAFPAESRITILDGTDSRMVDELPFVTDELGMIDRRVRQFTLHGECRLPYDTSEIS